MKLTLSYRPPFDFEGLLYFYRSHEMGDLERFEAGKMHRIAEFDGKVGTVTISNEPDKSRLLVEIDFPETSRIPAILSRVRSLFDIDSDPLLIANQIETDPKMKSLLKKHPGIRIPSGWDPFEVAVATILGQLVSVEQGRALVKDLIESLGKDSGLRFENRVIKLFPTPEQIASSDLKGLKTTQTRKDALVTFSKAILEKKLSLEPTQDVEEFIKKILTVRGIGPWTAHYIALKSLRNPDAFPETDLILARALELHSKEVVEQLRPWRGYAAALFWKEYSAVLTKKKKKL